MEKWGGLVWDTNVVKISLFTVKLFTLILSTLHTGRGELRGGHVAGMSLAIRLSPAENTRPRCRPIGHAIRRQAASPMATAILIADQIEIPAMAQGLVDFRRWAISDDFPERGRIDFVGGRIEVDLSPEDLHTHGTTIVEILAVLAGRIRQLELGEIYTSRARVSCPMADLSVEPDILFVSYDAMDSDRVRLIPKPGVPECYVEFEGSPDLIVEIVSDSTEGKDTQRLPTAYWQAGVREFWLVDARRSELCFRIHHRSDADYQPAPTDDDSYQYSAVLGCWYRLERLRNDHGRLRYALLEKAG